MPLPDDPSNPTEPEAPTAPREQVLVDATDVVSKPLLVTQQPDGSFRVTLGSESGTITAAAARQVGRVFLFDPPREGAAIRAKLDELRHEAEARGSDIVDVDASDEEPTADQRGWPGTGYQAGSARDREAGEVAL